MVVILIHAGLGNQLFQYYFGEYLKKAGINIEYTWDVSNNKGRAFSLTQLGYKDLKRFPLIIISIRRSLLARIVNKFFNGFYIPCIRDESLQNLTEVELFDYLYVGDFYLKG
jgi:hypothetical protein